MSGAELMMPHIHALHVEWASQSREIKLRSLCHSEHMSWHKICPWPLNLLSFVQSPTLQPWKCCGGGLPDVPHYWHCGGAEYGPRKVLPRHRYLTRRKKNCVGILKHNCINRGNGGTFARVFHMPPGCALAPLENAMLLHHTTHRLSMCM